MKKKLLSIVLALIVLTVPLTTYANQQVKLEINGNPIYSDVPPYIENGRTMVPLRLISETLGYNVSWDEEAQIVTIAGGTEQKPILLTLVIGKPKIVIFNSESILKSMNMSSDEYSLEETSKQLYENSKVNNIESAPKVISGRTFVPIRVIVENFGATVDWNQDTRTAKIMTSNEVVSKYDENGLYTQEEWDTFSIDIVGDRSTKIYYLTNDPDAKFIKPSDRVFFETNKEAKDAGYTPGGSIKPDTIFSNAQSDWIRERGEVLPK